MIEGRFGGAAEQRIERPLLLRRKLRVTYHCMIQLVLNHHVDARLIRLPTSLGEREKHHISPRRGAVGMGRRSLAHLWPG
jgi:hypothetical protein